MVGLYDDDFEKNRTQRRPSSAGAGYKTLSFRSGIWVRKTEISGFRERKKSHSERGTAMAARKRASANTSTEPQTKENAQPKSQEQTSTDSPIAPPKLGVILKLTLFFSLPYFYLLFRHYKIEQEIRRSILINAGLSLAGFFITVKMIPVASRYVLRRNLFGYDINKKGTPQGTIKVWVFLWLGISRTWFLINLIWFLFNTREHGFWTFLPWMCRSLNFFVI